MKRKVNTTTPAPTTITPAPTDLNGGYRVTKDEIQAPYYPAGKAIDMLRQTSPQAFELDPYGDEKRAFILDGEVVLKLVNGISGTANNWNNNVIKFVEVALLKLGQQLPRANTQEKKRHKVKGLDTYGISSARRIKITVDEYMEMTNRKSPNEVKKEMVKNIRVLQSTTVAFTDKVNGEKMDYSFVVVSGSIIPRTKGYVEFNLSEELVGYLYLLDRRRIYDIRAISIDTNRHPLAKKVYDYINQRYQDKVNTRQRGLGKLRIKTIIKNIPLLTAGKKKDKPIPRIINPLFETIGYLKKDNFLSEYRFITKYGTDYNDLTDEEINNMTYADYENLILEYKPSINK